MKAALATPRRIRFSAPIQEPAPERRLRRSASACHISGLAGCARRRLYHNAKAFFGAGGVAQPGGLAQRARWQPQQPPDRRAGCSWSAPSRSRRANSARSTSSTAIFPQGIEAEPLVEKYRSQRSHTSGRTPAAQWKDKGLRFETKAEPWVKRETAWHYYYLRSSLTYDDFFGEHILSQGGIYQYSMGFQGAARDPLQHALPFLFSDPRHRQGDSALHAERSSPGWLHPVWHCGARRHHAQRHG